MNVLFRKYKNVLLLCLVSGLLLFGQTKLVFASPAAEQESEGSVSDMIMGHVLDHHVWHFFDGSYGTLYLPVILYSSDRGLTFFSSSRFYDADHQHVAYKGYILEHNRIRSIHPGESVIDFSITKNVLMLFITAFLLFFLLWRVAKNYAVDTHAAPKGLQSLLEPVILFVTNEIIKPNAGPNYRRYTPYLLTLFFFILLGNILGLLPGAANLTGNIAVTMTLAVFTFLITTFSGNSQYWAHIFWTPGIPLPLRPIILAVEIIGIFSKPFSLMVRLFAAITAGHIVILSLLSLAFVFHSYSVGVGMSLFILVISLVELLVAGIQAYVFTLFSSLYIGMATAKHEH